MTAQTWTKHRRHQCLNWTRTKQGRSQSGWENPETSNYTKSYRQLRIAGSERNSLPLRKAHQLITQHQTVSSKNSLMSNNKQTEPLVFKDIYYMCTHILYTYDVCNSKKEVTNSNEKRELYGRGWRVYEKRRKKWGNYISKMKENIF